MKKASLFLTVALVISSGALFAQGFHIGVKGGVNMTKIDGQSFDNGFKWGISAGGFAELNFTKHLGIQPELLFNQTSTKTASNFSDIYHEGIPDRDVTLNYLSIPILLALKPSPVLSILLGPQFGIKLSESENISLAASNAFKSGDFSVVGGAQLNLGGFKLGARYVIGLNNLNDLNDNYKWKNQNVQLYIGLRIIYIF
jgi:hypothetical protein